MRRLLPPSQMRRHADEGLVKDEVVNELLMVSREDENLQEMYQYCLKIVSRSSKTSTSHMGGVSE